jgi:hypothetical protein
MLNRDFELNNVTSNGQLNADVAASAYLHFMVILVVACPVQSEAGSDTQVPCAVC